VHDPERRRSSLQEEGKIKENLMVNSQRAGTIVRDCDFIEDSGISCEQKLENLY